MPQNESLVAEIIAIGDELTSGQRLDTNSQWLSQQLGDLGIRTLFHTTVADDLDANVAAFRSAAGRANLVLATGGLGPTADDLTRESMALAFERTLELDSASLEHIQAMFRSRGREMPERNRVQALFPQGSRPVPNPHGTAPGVDFLTPNGRCRIFALPGVPAEMKDMYAETVRPALLLQHGKRLRPVRHYRLKCFGTGESALEAMLPDLIRRGRQPTVGITVSHATITLRITGQAASESAFHDLIQPTVAIIHETLGDLVFGTEDDELQHAVCRLLKSTNNSLAVSEWGTAGLVAHWMQDLVESTPASQPIFAGGFVVSGIESAQSSLEITVGNLSPQELAQQMAEAARLKSKADIGISVGPIPASNDGKDAKVFIGLATADVSKVIGRHFAGHPSILMTRAAKQALNEVRLHLIQQDRGR